jgi:hypothetical protein
MTITGPYEFRLYSQEGADLEMIRKVGLEPTRVIFNDGSVPISGYVDGERQAVLWVRPIAPRKRNTPYDAPDDERDRFAEFVAKALNAADPTQ